MKGEAPCVRHNGQRPGQRRGPVLRRRLAGEITDSSITGGVTITGTTLVLVFEDTVRGPVRIYDNPAVD